MSIPSLRQQGESYVLIHVPSAFRSHSEQEIADLLLPSIELEIPVVIHPDTIKHPDCWRKYGPLLCIENMDKRKSQDAQHASWKESLGRFPMLRFASISVTAAKSIQL